MKHSHIAISFCAASALGIGAIFVVQHVRAAGIPASGTLTYTGSLENPDGSAVTAASKNIALFIYDAATASNAIQDCSVMSGPIALTQGRFQVALPEKCPAVVRANPELWIEVQVDGLPLGRTKLGAVPYAVEAGNAVTATTVTGAQTQQLVPSGAVMFFHLATCPAGWTALPAAQGRYLVGLTSGGTLAAGVGTALTDRENRAVGQHTHTVADPGHNHGGVTNGVTPFAGTDSNRDYNNLGSTDCLGISYIHQMACSGLFSSHTHGISSSVTGVTLANAGAVSGTSAPYLQLLACQKI